MTTVTDFVDSTLPTSSVEKNSTVCEPSFEWSPGAEMTTEVPVRVLPPSTRYEVWATPEPAPSSAVNVTVTGALLGLAGDGVAVVTGAVWSTRTVIVLDVKELPARSVVVTRSSYEPSETACGPEAVSHVEGVTVQAPPPAGRRSKTIVSTPDAEPLTAGSAESLASVTAGTPISPPFAGAVTEPVGAVLSTRTVIVGEVKLPPALSVVTTRRS